MKKLYLLLIVFIVLCTTLFPTSNGVAFAATSVYSDVLADLQVDESFSTENYPVDNTDYGIYVFQIAESTDKELLLYVYQPCVEKDFRATSINMSLTITNFDSSIQPRVYYLEYLNSDNTLYKYKVKDFTVSEDATRYYEIYSVWRAYDSSIDPAPSGNDQTINERVFNVGKRFTCGQINGNYSISCKDVTKVDITDMFVGFIRYENSSERSYIYLGEDDPVDSHLVAFSTSNSIDRVLEAKVFYQRQDYYWHKDYMPDGQFGEIEDKYAELSYTQTASFTSSGWFSYGTYEWGRIQTVDEMIFGENREKIYHCGAFNVRAYSALSESAISDLRSYQYVLRFTETPWRQMFNANGMYLDRRVIVSNVSILRLKYEYEGQVYDLGVVSNKQTGSNNPLNESKTTVELSDEFKEFLLILCIIIGVLILCIILPYVLKFVGFVLKIIIAPFKWIFGSSRRRDRDRRR